MQPTVFSAEIFSVLTSCFVEYLPNPIASCKLKFFSWAIRVNHAAEYLCRVAILNPFQESYFLGERIISFERAETKHDIKVSSPKQQSNEVSIYIEHICINFHVVFFAENFRECAILNAVHEEIFKLHIFIESRLEYFLKGTRS